jgi:acyl homoserine lactone synthase
MIVGVPPTESTMIKAVYAADLFRRPVLAASMFRDRAAQFHDRLGWPVNLDDMGLEFDQYDELNPLYIVIEGGDGQHVASTRIMPTTGRTMVAEHFLDLTGGVPFQSALIWESTRFCISPRIKERSREGLRAPTALLWAGAEIALRAGVEFFIAVFGEAMFRFYKSNNWNPEVLGSRESPEGPIYAGLWEVTPAIRDTLARRAGIDGPEALSFYPDISRFPFVREVATAPVGLPVNDERRFAIAC